MSIGKRPGGLTALAIIHLVLGAFGVLGLIMTVGFIVFLDTEFAKELLDEAAKQSAAPAEAPAEPGAPEGAEDPDGPGAEAGEAGEPDPVAVEVETDPDLEEFREMWQGSGRVYLFANLFLSFVATVLQIVSGAGYLGQKRVLGRYVGNAYCLLALGSVGVSLAVPQPGASEWMYLVGLVIPVVTLILINTTFRDDLVR